MTGLMDSLVAVIAVLSIFALPLITALILIYKKLSSVHKERMGLIQQGIIPPNEPKRKSIPNRYRSLRNGIILVWLGLGVIVGFVTANNLGTYENKFFIVIAIIVLFLGLGYLSFFLITRNIKINNGDKVDGYLEEDFE
jgi:hypothetical protein